MKHTCWHGCLRFIFHDYFYIRLLYPPHNEVVGDGGGDSFHSVRLPVRPSRIPCPLCSAYSSWSFDTFLKSVTLTCFHFGNWCESLVCVIMVRRGYLRKQAFLVSIWLCRILFGVSKCNYISCSLVPSIYCPYLHPSAFNVFFIYDASNATKLLKD